MKPKRSSEHTTLTETAALVVHELERTPGVKRIAPGIITPAARKRTGGRFITAVYTNAGLELIISGQSVQKVAVHTDTDPKKILAHLKTRKKLRDFTFSERTRKPGTDV